MNVEGAEVERGLGRSIMPRFHAAWSLGGIAGAGVGVAIRPRDVPMLGAPRPGRCVLAAGASARTRAFLPADGGPGGRRSAPGSAWLEPRTLAIGVMVLAFAVAEGSANDWLSLALIDGYDVEHWVGVTGYVALRLRDDGRPADRAGRCSTGSAGRRCCG